MSSYRDHGRLFYCFSDDKSIHSTQRRSGNAYIHNTGVHQTRTDQRNGKIKVRVQRFISSIKSELISSATAYPKRSVFRASLRRRPSRRWRWQPSRCTNESSIFEGRRLQERDRHAKHSMIRYANVS
jgi:hypothetical protein